MDYTQLILHLLYIPFPLVWDKHKGIFLLEPFLLPNDKTITATMCVCVCVSQMLLEGKQNMLLKSEYH